MGHTWIKCNHPSWAKLGPSQTETIVMTGPKTLFVDDGFLVHRELSSESAVS